MRSKNLFTAFSGGILLYGGFDFNKHAVFAIDIKQSIGTFLDQIDLNQRHIDLKDHRLTLEDMQDLAEEIQKSNHVGHIEWGRLPANSEQLKQKIEDKIINNNKNHQHYPGDFTYALLSSHVYTDSSIGNKVEFEYGDENYKYNQYLMNWQVQNIYDKPEAGRYYAASYINNNDFQLVLAHRGTTAKLSDLLEADSPIMTDLKGILAEKIVAQLIEASIVTEQAVDYTKKRNYSFSTTGHSLGAWLAELSLYFAFFDFKAIYPKAVTFDSPGSIVMENYASNVESWATYKEIKNLDITTYLAPPNFVNSCNKHVGKVYNIFPEVIKPAFVEKGMDNVNNFLNFMIGHKKINIEDLGAIWSIFGHSLNPLISTFDPITGKPSNYTQVYDWPIIKYSPKQSPGQNMLRTLYDKAKGFIIYSPLNPIWNKISETTLIKISNLLLDSLSGNIDQSQYLKCWEYLVKAGAKDYFPNAYHQFSLKYEGHYATLEVNEFSDVLKAGETSIGSADWYLKQLAMLSTNEINQELGLNSIAGKQLRELKNEFKITPNSSKYYINSNNKTIDQIRELIIRLIDVTPKIKPLLEGLEKGAVIINNAGYLKNNIELERISNFILHKNEVEILSKILASNKHAVIAGVLGIGKSSLAAEYGYIQQDRPGSKVTVLWVSAENIEKIQVFYIEQAKKLGIEIGNETPDTIIRLVHNKIEFLGNHVLFIFDNAETETYPYVKKCIGDLPKEAKSIITTRHANLEGSSGKSKQIELKGFTIQEAIDYLKTSDISSKITNDKEVEELVEYLSSEDKEILPFKLKRAVDSIKQDMFGGIKDYLDKVKHYPDDEAETAIWRELLSKSELSWKLLQYSTYLDPDFISIDIFKELFAVDSDTLQASIKALESLSEAELIWRDGKPGLKLHRLTQSKITIYLLRHPEHSLPSQVIRQDLLETLDTLFPYVSNNPDHDWDQAGKIMPHVKKMIDQGRQVSNLFTAELNYKLGAYYEEVLNLYDESLAYREKALEIYQALYKGNHPAIANSLNNIGAAYYKLGDIKKALDYYEEALKICQTLYKGNHPAIANSLNNIGAAYGKLGDIKKLLYCQEKALKIRQALYKGDHPDIASSLNNVGVVYLTLGDIKKSLDYKEKALKMRQALYEEDHPDIASSLNAVGVAYQTLGDTKKGLDYQEKALKIRQALYKGDHPDIAGAVGNIGVAYQTLGDTKKALDYQEKALKMHQALYKGDHPDIATNLNNVGSAYQELGDIKKALDYKEKALKMHQALCKGDNPNIAASLDYVGSAYQELGDIKKALDYKEKGLKMHQTLYKGDHPDIASSLYNIGVAYYELGDQSKSIELFKQAYIIRVKKLGHKHPATEQSKQILLKLAPEFVQSNEEREMIIKRGDIDTTTLEVKQKLQTPVLNKIQRFAANGNQDIKKYLKDSYLHKQLEKLSSPKTLEIAKMLCFEAINLGIMSNANKNLACAEEFSKSYPELTQKIAKEHPEYFVDGLILRATTQPSLYESLLASRDAVDDASLNAAATLEDIKKGLDYKEMLEMNQTLYKGDHPDIATSLNNVGIAYEPLGDIKKDLDYKEKALKIYQTLYKGNHPDIATSLGNIGIAYETLGDIKKGLDYKEKALKMYKALYKGNHPGIATSLNNVGVAYGKLGDMKKDLDYQEKALEMNQALYTGNHPDIATSLNNVGIAYESLEDIKKGLDYKEKALKMYQTLYKGDHPDIATSLNRVGVAYYKLGDQSKFIELFKQAYIIRVKKLGPNHSDTEKLKQILLEVAPEFVWSNEQREMIIERGDIDTTTLEVKQKLQTPVLNKIQKLVSYDIQDIKKYLEDSYLHEQLGKLSSLKTLEIAKMLCFEAINLGIMSNANKNLACAEEFSKSYPELTQKIAKEHPEYFVDGLILRATTQPSLYESLLASRDAVDDISLSESPREQMSIEPVPINEAEVHPVGIAGDYDHSEL